MWLKHVASVATWSGTIKISLWAWAEAGSYLIHPLVRSILGHGLRATTTLQGATRGKGTCNG